MTGVAGIEINIKEPEPIPERFVTDRSVAETKTVINDVKKQLRDYWHCLR
jgi:hypothetical protein